MKSELHINSQLFEIDSFLDVPVPLNTQSVFLGLQGDTAWSN